MTSLFDPMQLGDVDLKSRIVMAPMTRSRADGEDVPGDLTIEYYKQRADAGLIITEATQPSPNGKGYPRTPGIYTQAQIEGWQRVTQAVHQAGGKIFLQIMHAGRIAHPLNKPQGAETVAPSAVAAAGKMYTDQQGLQEMTMPRALETHEIPRVIEEYKQATVNAFIAGFDGWSYMQPAVICLCNFYPVILIYVPTNTVGLCIIVYAL
jgi:N-ethylmaleimide reductase